MNGTPRDPVKSLDGVNPLLLNKGKKRITYNPTATKPPGLLFLIPLQPLAFLPCPDRLAPKSVIAQLFSSVAGSSTYSLVPYLPH